MRLLSSSVTSFSVSLGIRWARLLQINISTLHRVHDRSPRRAIHTSHLSMHWHTCHEWQEVDQQQVSREARSKMGTEMSIKVVLSMRNSHVIAKEPEMLRSLEACVYSNSSHCNTMVSVSERHIGA